MVYCFIQLLVIFTRVKVGKGKPNWRVKKLGQFVEFSNNTMGPNSGGFNFYFQF